MLQCRDVQEALARSPAEPPDHRQTPAPHQDQTLFYFSTAGLNGKPVCTVNDDWYGFTPLCPHPLIKSQVPVSRSSEFPKSDTSPRAGTFISNNKLRHFFTPKINSRHQLNIQVSFESQTFLLRNRVRNVSPISLFQK